MGLTRRQFISGASALGVAASLELSGCAHSKATQVLAPPGIETLRSAGAGRGILVGAAVGVQPLRNDPGYAALVGQQCGIVVAENAMKFGPLRPAPDQFFYDDADFLLDFAEKNGMKVRGHNFVWHRQLPRWFDTYATPQNAEQILVDHIQRVGSRYAGRIHSWDVCNEVILLKDGQPHGLRNSPWFKLLGPGYIDLAYRTARSVDPHALLCYNDYDIESEAPDHAAKRAAVLELLRGMQGRGVPIDGLGIQSHIAAGSAHAYGPEHAYGPGLPAFMKEVQGMGLKLLLTEMDVNDRALSADNAVRDAAVAQAYGSYLQTTLANPEVTAVLTWGLTDKYTWLNGEDSRPDHLPERCLPFDADLAPTLACRAEVAALAAAPQRAAQKART